MKKTILAQVLLKIKNFVGEDEQPIITGSNALRIFGLLNFSKETAIKLDGASNDSMMIESSETTYEDFTRLLSAPPDKSRSADVDIVLINPKEETVKKLRSLQEIIPAHTAPLDDVYSKLIAIFSVEIDGVKVKVDVFREDEDYLQHVTEATFSGCRVSSIRSIIEKKRSYNRKKDDQDLIEWSRLFFDHVNSWKEKINNLFNL